MASVCRQTYSSRARRNKNRENQNDSEKPKNDIDAFWKNHDKENTNAHQHLFSSSSNYESFSPSSFTRGISIDEPREKPSRKTYQKNKVTKGQGFGNVVSSTPLAAQRRSDTISDDSDSIFAVSRRPLRQKNKPASTDNTTSALSKRPPRKLAQKVVEKNAQQIARNSRRLNRTPSYDFSEFNDYELLVKSLSPKPDINLPSPVLNIVSPDVTKSTDNDSRSVFFGATDSLTQFVHDLNCASKVSNTSGGCKTRSFVRKANNSSHNSHHSVNNSTHNSHNNVKNSTHNSHHNVKNSTHNSHHSVNNSTHISHHSVNNSAHNSHHSVNNSTHNSHHNVKNSSHNSHHSVNDSTRNSHHSVNDSTHNSHNNLSTSATSFHGNKSHQHPISPDDGTNYDADVNYNSDSLFSHGNTSVSSYIPFSPNLPSRENSHNTRSRAILPSHDSGHSYRKTRGMSRDENNSRVHEESDIKQLQESFTQRLSLGNTSKVDQEVYNSDMTDDYTDIPSDASSHEDPHSCSDIFNNDDYDNVKSAEHSVIISGNLSNIDECDHEESERESEQENVEHENERESELISERILRGDRRRTCVSNIEKTSKHDLLHPVTERDKYISEPVDEHVSSISSCLYEPVLGEGIRCGTCVANIELHEHHTPDRSHQINREHFTVTHDAIDTDTNYANTNHNNDTSMNSSMHSEPDRNPFSSHDHDQSMQSVGSIDRDTSLHDLSLVSLHSEHDVNEQSQHLIHQNDHRHLTSKHGTDIDDECEVAVVKVRSPVDIDDHHETINSRSDLRDSIFTSKQSHINDRDSVLTSRQSHHDLDLSCRVVLDRDSVFTSQQSHPDRDSIFTSRQSHPDLDLSCRIVLERLSTVNSEGSLVSGNHLLHHGVRSFENLQTEDADDPLPIDSIMKTPDNKNSNHCNPSNCCGTPRMSFRATMTPKLPSRTSARDCLLKQCDQTQPISFTKCMPSGMLGKCKKIGEGVYGEVFRSVNSQRMAVAVKIIPIEGDITVNGEKQKKFAEILPEVAISTELSHLRHTDMNSCENFIQVYKVSCVQGSYPRCLIKEWDLFDVERGSDNDRPDKFTDAQLFVVFEFAFAGTSLEDFEFTEVSEGVSVLSQVAHALAIAECQLQFEHRDLHWGNVLYELLFLPPIFTEVSEGISVLSQVAHALAIAECQLQFEHRDLHWGNVLVKRTCEESVQYVLNGAERRVPSHGVLVTIIDFTLSRLSKEDTTTFCNLANDPEIFQGQGDIQFDIYRSMQQESGDEWETFNPHTNVSWLYYIADKIFNVKTYNPTTNKRSQLSQLRNMRKFVGKISEYRSAFDIVTSASELTG